jgi:recombination protein RecA
MTEQERQRAIRLKLARMSPDAAASISTGLPLGDLPRGSIVEMFGPSGSGKTSVALAMVAHWQSSGGSAAWVDAEHSFDPRYAAELGVRVEQLPVAQPQSAEQAFAILRELAASGAVELLVVDSAAALVPALELDIALGLGASGLQSRVLASGLRTAARVAARSGATMLFLNQTRSRPGEEELSAGGPGLKLHAAVRIALAAAAEPGCARFRLLKNKAGEPFREGKLRWNPAREPGENI